MTIGTLTDQRAGLARAHQLDLHRVRDRVDTALDRFLDYKVRTAPDMCLPPLIDALRDFIEGGKRLRPLFLYCGWAAAGDQVDDEVAVRVGVAMELFHSFALIHGDVVDSAEVRRGKPTVHRMLADHFNAPANWRSAQRFGMSTAVLLGDLCCVWSDEVFAEAALEEGRRREAAALLHVMRTELIAGQYLDLAAESHNPLRDAWRVVRMKTARYSVELPLRVGAVLGGADRRTLDVCRAYGRPVGEAFQLRDDLLGVFGDPEVTGKSDLDDLRRGKGTVLMALAWKHATTAQRELIVALHGKPDLNHDEAQRLRQVIVATGAKADVERLISSRAERALAVLDVAPVAPEVKRALTELATAATCRNR
ncbi:geranylgeranyl diphosphate synthase type I [Saccharothrix ecbatanensis]|jgi:geranylgeranyl diphosphate synthase type I|uniref:Geranylgeranyl diphosphate synthase type I n=1 Tax=Saccharothrix ecbatanensis TaxID=1105145 RepID=A0A7W9M0L3_9PSEU|nr:polyprenyl synthetase family protein [Saccharothrix ecbatanensis]MBB5803065.1 geranylgeranyl diphosphate synthase type I [Saccharothrix ecbatanensis]